MVDVSNSRKLEVWLKNRPREDSVVIAARIALRALPVLWTAREQLGEEWAPDLLMPTLRVVAAPWVAASCPTHGAEIAYAAAAAAFGTFPMVSTAAAAARAAAATTTAAANAAAAASATAHGPVVLAAPAEADANALERGMSAQDLATRPLWPDPGMPEDITEMWSDMSALLRDKSEGWEVWTDWYEARLAGGEVNEDLEVALVLVDPKLWEKPPAEINAHMARLIGRAKNGTLPTAAETARTYRARYMQDDEADEDPKPGLAAQIADLRARLDALDIDETKIAEIRAELARFEELKAEIGRLDAETERLSMSIATREEELGKHATALTSETKRREELKGLLEAAHTEAKGERERIVEELRGARTDLLGQLMSEAENKAPAELWSTKAGKHEIKERAAYILFAIGLVGIAVAIVALFSALVGFPSVFDSFFSLPTAQGEAPKLGFTPKGVLFTAGVLTLFTLALWFTRLQMKVYLAERHLALDARERIAFSQTYLVMLEGEKYLEQRLEGLDEDAQKQMIKDAQAQKQLVYAALFRPTSDGIVKEETGLDPSISAAISKLLASK